MPFHERRSDPLWVPDADPQTIRRVNETIANYGAHIEQDSSAEVQVVSGPFADLSDQIRAQEAVHDALLIRPTQQ